MLPVDDCVSKMWDICLDTDNDGDSDGVAFTIRSDQWWVVNAICKHGVATGASRSLLDLSTAFNNALSRFEILHQTW